MALDKLSERPSIQPKRIDHGIDIAEESFDLRRDFAIAPHILTTKVILMRDILWQM
jgi:hypothetical protein